MSSNPEPSSGVSASRTPYALIVALAVAGAAAGAVAVATTPVTGIAVLVPFAAVAVVGARRWAARNDPERTDERARMLVLSAKAQAYDSLLGFVGGSAVYQWIVHGRAQATPLVNVIIGALVVHAIVLASLRRRA
jgi:hypothetical protein